MYLDEDLNTSEIISLLERNKVEVIKQIIDNDPDLEVLSEDFNLDNIQFKVDGSGDVGLFGEIFNTIDVSIAVEEESLNSRDKKYNIEVEGIVLTVISYDF